MHTVEIHANLPPPTVTNWDKVSEVLIYTHSLDDLAHRVFLTEATKHRKNFRAMNEDAKMAMYRFVT